jgi:hypothetical protein
MRIIKLKCESDQPAYDQMVREVLVEREDENNWYGKPLANPACPTLHWPKFAWKEVKHNEGPGKRCNASLTHAPNFHPQQEENSMLRQNSNITRPNIGARFAIGQVFITPGAQEALDAAGQTAIQFLRRHVSMDWGEVSEEDAQENELALREGFRLLSAYRTSAGTRIWIITESDRSFSTVLRPDEY